MSTSRIYRLLRLVTLLQGTRGQSVDDLARELEVSRRTVFRDLNMLELAHIPYYYDPDTGGYRISRHFFLPPVSLTLSESLAILMMTGRLRTSSCAAAGGPGCQGGRQGRERLAAGHSRPRGQRAGPPERAPRARQPARGARRHVRRADFRHRHAPRLQAGLHQLLREAADAADHPSAADGLRRAGVVRAGLVRCGTRRGGRSSSGEFAS